MVTRLVLAVGLLAIACGDSRPAAPAPAPAARAGAAEEGAPGLAAPVFEVDGHALEVGPLGDASALLAIEGLPPIEEWGRIVAADAEGRRFVGARPLALTGERRMELVRGEGGFDFRVVERRADGSEVVRQELRAVTRVEIHTLAHASSPPTAPSLVIVEDGGRYPVDAAALDGLPRVAEPGRDDARDVWTLRDVVGAERLAGARELVLRNRAGDQLVIHAADLAAATRLELLKRNRRGQLQYRQWVLGESPRRTAELRDVVEIELRSDR